MDRATLEELSVEQLKAEARKFDVTASEDRNTLVDGIMSHLERFQPVEPQIQEQSEAGPSGTVQSQTGADPGGIEQTDSGAGLEGKCRAPASASLGAGHDSESARGAGTATTDVAPAAAAVRLIDTGIERPVGGRTGRTSGCQRGPPGRTADAIKLLSGQY